MTFTIGGNPYWPRPDLIYTGLEPKTQDEAWDITVAKWKFLTEHPDTEDGGVSTCGLCLLYYTASGDCCVGCPIDAAGHHLCKGTPYRDYLCSHSAGDAQREVEFLEALRG